ncbi:hypothetical protein SAMN05444722_3730 [Rhodovulum sp. ES.010]|uniref:hypothetical protein n=1 Tax=Rhodovulum sp. ES.010 TaxID=1882821 RepID=UPI00092BC7CE|nr:hypothetical protein [Rhodovulum sp. ES.010]SIO57439.1 hypothetical protein SAMN05444722_3730 [Rhodovulum sp. ES.010]
MRLALTLSAALLLAACVPQGPTAAPDALRTYRGNLVVPDPTVPGQFEVFTVPGDAGRDLWCAAGIYAIDELNVPATRRIHLVRPLGSSDTRPGRKSAVFTVSPDAEIRVAAEALPDDLLTLGVTRPGRNFLPMHARNSCRPVIRFPFGG